MQRKLSKTFVDGAQYTDLVEPEAYTDKNGRIQWKPCLIRDTHQDAPRGFALRISPQGKRTFVLDYRVQGRRRMLSLGEYGQPVLEPRNGGEETVALTLVVARKRAHRELAKVHADRDPVKEKRLERRHRRDAQSFTFEQLAEDYLEAGRESGRKSWPEEERQLKKDAYPVFGDKPAAEVDPDDVDRALQRILKRASKPRKVSRGKGKQARSASKGGKIAANRLRTCLISVFNFALRDPRWRMRVRFNPALTTQRPFKHERRKRRTRYLDSDEIRRLWKALGDEGLDPVVSASFKLRLLSGTRVTETHRLRWKDVGETEVELDGAKLKVPYVRLRSETTKTGQELILPLSDQALEIFETLKPITGEGPWILDSPRKPHRPVGSLAKATKRIGDLAKLDDFNGHDLRRTLVTLMPSLGVDQSLVSRIVGHTDNTITGQYNQWLYVAERYEALQKWGDWIERVVKSKPEDNVVEMADRRSRSGSPTTA